MPFHNTQDNSSTKTQRPRHTDRDSHTGTHQQTHRLTFRQIYRQKHICRGKDFLKHPHRQTPTGRHTQPYTHIHRPTSKRRLVCSWTTDKDTELGTLQTETLTHTDTQKQPLSVTSTHSDTYPSTTPSTNPKVAHCLKQFECPFWNHTDTQSLRERPHTLSETQRVEEMESERKIWIIRIAWSTLLLWENEFINELCYLSG